MKAAPKLADVLKALADPTRLRMVALLGSEEICVCHIHTALRVPQPTASRHLSYLKRVGMVEDRRVGLWKHYRLRRLPDPAVQAVVDAARKAAGDSPGVARDCCRLVDAVRLIRSPIQTAPMA